MKSTPIKVLLREARSERATSQAAIDRALRACRQLGLDRAETIDILDWLGLADNTGTPYRPHFKINLPGVAA